MSWAKHYVQKLQEGQTVEFAPVGNSMTPLIKSREIVQVMPVKSNDLLEPDDIVLVRVKGRVYLHLITAVKRESPDVLYQISNNKGHVNGWVTRSAIYGICVRIGDQAR